MASAGDAALPDPLGDAVAWLGAGQLIAFPTETVWGLAADARSEAALERLRAWKGRSEASPIALLVSGVEALAELGCRTGPAARRIAESFWPGPLTLVVPCRSDFPAGIARSDGAVGFRCSSHPLAAALERRLRVAGLGPITATSLNRSGEPPAAGRGEAEALCGAPEGPRLLAVDRAECGGSAASTVVDCTAAEPVVLRWGAIPREELLPYLGSEVQR